MKFSEFIKESVNVWKPQTLSSKEIIKWCESNAKEFLQWNRPIYRGTKIANTGLLDTKQLNRKSAHTSNHYTLWLDNSLKWAQYPKRSESIICSQNLSVASDYGDVCYVIPEDTAKIGVCPDSDFWESFYPYSPDTVNNWLNNVKIPDDSWSNMLKAIRSYDQDVRNSKEFSLSIWEFIKRMDCKSLEEALDKYFDPIKQNFKFTTAKKPPDNNNVELWVSGKVMMIDKKAALSDVLLTKFLEEHFEL